MLIVHISTDYPDDYAPGKTHAISNLVNATQDSFDHLVYSLNRVPTSPINGMMRWGTRNWRSGFTHYSSQDNINIWTYSAPSNGLFLRSSLQALAETIIDDLDKKGIKPDLIQGHKLSMEGLVAEIIARHFDIPYALSIQGNTDRNILNIRRDLRPIYRRIFHNAKIIFPFAPWAFEYCEKTLGARAGRTNMLPCITFQDSIIPPQICPPHIMSAFHLRHWKIKNFHHMVRAAAIAEHKADNFAFDIFGGGDDNLQASLGRDIAKSGAQKTALCGPVSANEMQSVMNRYAGFAMVSKRETYGMVFAEALLAGCPIIYPKDAAVDGYFDGNSFAQAVPPNDMDALVDAMMNIIAHQKAIKNDLKRWQLAGDAQQFRQTAIIQQYRDGLLFAINKGTRNAH